MTKIVIATVPFVDTETPMAAPAVLKSALQARGVDCVGLDLNIEIYNKIKHDPRRDKFLDFFYNQVIEDDIVEDLIKMLDFYSCEILAHKPEFVGLSLFCSQCQTFTAWLCAVLRQTAPDLKIVIGGPGLETLENNLFKYPDRLKRLGLIDDYITGDAETSLAEYVLGNKTYPGINSLTWVPYENFINAPRPDFSDYRFFKYSHISLPIIDSRGCVQDCEFCDVVAFWKKFQYQSAETIFDAMQYYVENYGISRFHFASSICNGNLKEFRKLIVLIAEYNDNHTEAEHIHWMGSFIVRPKNNHPESMWELIKRSNGFLLTGVESIVENVRINLGKKFTNEDLDHHLMMAKKYKVGTNLLLIAGYHTETVDDYEMVKQWFRDRKDYASDPIHQVQLTTVGILPGTRLEASINRTEFNQTAAQRYKQAVELNEVIKSCGFITNIFF
jgi:radical SAM superfamily enzyme YgiQ (UPF0313 family)